MTWNWQREDWPNFTFDSTALESMETRFLHEAGVLIGAFKHLDRADKRQLTIEIISDEALKTSEIEGEHLSRESVQSSLRRQFGIQTDATTDATTDYRRIPPAEQGVSELMVDLYRSFGEPLTHGRLFTWHEMLMRGHRDVKEIGAYRTRPEPMQVVSASLYDPKIHFEAPPSERMQREMDRFIFWFNKRYPGNGEPLPPLTRAGIAHLHFVSVHPFEDGNGRIGRAIAEKALAESVGQPTLIALAHTIEKHKRAYYSALAGANTTNEITPWLIYFTNTILDAQKETVRRITFLIEKTKLFDRLRGHLNNRQEKALARMFRGGPEGFEGGLSAGNYIRLTRSSRATATRDLQDLVVKGALVRVGERKNTRYYLNTEKEII